MLYIQRTNDPYHLIDGIKFASFVGAGGKTTLTEHFARGCLAHNKSVAITTTTKIFAVEPFVLFDDWKTSRPNTSFVRIGKTFENGKLTALSHDEMIEVGKVYDVVLIEADGAKNYPLKFPADHEPVLMPYFDRVFIVAGMDALFKPFSEMVFRSELFRERTGIDPRLVYPDVFLRLFSEDALLKGTDGMSRTIVLNKYDTCRHRHMAAVLLKQIMEKTGISEGIIAAAKYGIWYTGRKIMGPASLIGPV